MRNVCATLLALFLGTAGPAHAGDARTDPTATGPSRSDAKPLPDRGERLDKLFADLKREKNDKAAERIAERIWREWLQSGSPTIDLLMQWAGDAVKAQKWPVALDFLDQVTTLAPSYAAGWNQRATVHFLMDDYPRSMADIEETLELEPRHFGALSGMAAILENTGNKKRALEAYERVLSIYPMNRAAQAKVDSLTQELAGESL